MDIIISLLAVGALLLVILVVLLIIVLMQNPYEKVHKARVRNDIRKIKQKVLSSDDEL